jgi:ribonuclease HI
MLKVYFDGACSDNGSRNADTGLGYWVYDEESREELLRCSRYGGKGTNNTAEYKALIEVLECLAALKLVDREVLVQGDSNLVINQVFGTWKCNQVHLIPLRDKVRELLSGFSNIRGQWIPREQNKLADELSKEGITKSHEEISTKENEKIKSAGMSIVNVGDGIFKVTSKGSGKSYAIDINNNVCSCPDNQYRHNECKHLRMVKNAGKTVFS